MNISGLFLAGRNLLQRLLVSGDLIQEFYIAPVIVNRRMRRNNITADKLKPLEWTTGFF
jgi:hypothetical protein